MKPYITDAFKDGKFVLKFQCEGKSYEQIQETLQGTQVTAYAMPDTHSFQSAWLFQLFFSNGCVVEFSSSCTEVGGWQEVGSLNLRFDQELTLDQAQDATLCVKTGVEKFYVKSIDRLIYEDADVYAECGIVFSDSSGREILVAAGPAPGSVSVQAPFSTGEFQPEFAMTKYKRVSI
ncbi:hypothetical protein [Paraherbaspirillum soli]|uniref:Uncharacterized protein n=1 Tax=Paraherbaspirillum soli TaxID=631222 RepID=A0ABW0MDQ7_9BURK